MRHPIVQRIPEGLRSTPMRFAGPIAAGAILVAALAVAAAPPAATGDGAVTTLASQEARSTPRSTPRFTPQPTVRATPEPSATPSPAAADPTSHPTEQVTPDSNRAFGSKPNGPVQQATVASVTDGDTIRVILDGQNLPVRYIGIDTPETRNGVEWMGREASDANARLVAGREVVLEKDVSETDRFGRLLRHVWIETDAGWMLVSLELLRLGVAQVTTFPPDVKYVDELLLPAQRAARDAGIGLWGSPPAVASTPAPILPLVPGQNCEPSYPDICIPIGAADLDCGQVEARRFTVLWDVPDPDPHRFDGNGDGVGCES